MIDKDTFITGNLNENHKTHRKAAMYAILGDLLFIVLPLVVISIVDVSVGRSFFAIIESPELSFGSAVLFGQTIIKCPISSLWRPANRSPDLTFRL
jgi:hypothetical protein